MPELPEVETTRRGIEPHVCGQVIKKIIVRQHQLRWKIPGTLDARLRNQTILSVDRRGKYLLLNSTPGTLLIHLGMSGSLRLLNKDMTPEKHDHVDVLLQNGTLLRYTDPRRFGAWLWAGKKPLEHKLLAPLGPEPLSKEFDAEYLWTISRGRKVPIKSFLMNSHIVVGVGNIYASEALFRAGIHPKRLAGRISLARYEKLTSDVKSILKSSIKQGGTTLRDFVNGDGKPGYFQQSLQVYARGGQACTQCVGTIREIRIGQRSSFYCPQCQR